MHVNVNQKQVFAAAKVSAPVTDSPQVDNSAFLYPYKLFSVIKFALANMFFRGTYFEHIMNRPQSHRFIKSRLIN